MAMAMWFVQPLDCVKPSASGLSWRVSERWKWNQNAIKNPTDSLLSKSDIPAMDPGWVTWGWHKRFRLLIRYLMPEGIPLLKARWLETVGLLWVGRMASWLNGCLVFSGSLLLPWARARLFRFDGQSQHLFWSQVSDLDGDNSALKHS